VVCLSVMDLDVCPLLSDDSKLQLISRYRPLLLICVDRNREDIACLLLQHGCNYAITDNRVTLHVATNLSFDLVDNVDCIVLYGLLCPVFNTRFTVLGLP